MNLRKVEFLNRLLKLSHCYDDLISFLMAEKLLSDFEKSTLNEDVEKAKTLVELLEKLKKDDKLLLLDYEWSILPIERLKLTVITPRDTREFSYNTN